MTAQDVQFATGMTIHHQAALDMARAHQTDPAARNGLLALTNADMVTDRSREVALMRMVTAACRGDAAAVQVDPSMIHGIAVPAEAKR